jgi:hypothetical protein
VVTQGIDFLWVARWLGFWGSKLGMAERQRRDARAVTSTTSRVSACAPRP